MSGVIITGMDMPDTCKECRKESSFQVVGIDCAFLNHKDCPLKSVNGLIAEIKSKAITHGQVVEGEYFAEDAENINYGLDMAIEIIKEYCKEEQEE